jgi:hypothetical protein
VTGTWEQIGSKLTVKSGDLVMQGTISEDGKKVPMKYSTLTTTFTLTLK